MNLDETKNIKNENQTLKDKLLIVEDEEDTLYILNRLLKKNNYEVRTAINGAEALKILQDGFIPKVIVADWTMPQMDGLQLCDIVKSNDKYKLTYFIVLTARASLKDRVMGLDVGADDFLVKPVENQELLARIRSGIRIHNLQNQLKKVEHSKAIVELACTIGHQLNNPLSSLIMTLKNLQDEIGEDEIKNYSDDFLIINQSIERMSKLIDDLKNIQNPEMINYTDNNKMLKLD